MKLQDLKSISPLLHHRVRSMVEDGYTIRHCTQLNDYVSIRLINFNNCKLIRIFYNNKTQWMCQYANEKLVYDGIVQG